jgi:hypothetical protein
VSADVRDQLGRGSPKPPEDREDEYGLITPHVRHEFKLSWRVRSNSDRVVERYAP